MLEYWPSLFDYLHTEGQYAGVYKIISPLTVAYEPFGNDYSICLSTNIIPSALWEVVWWVHTKKANGQQPFANDDAIQNLQLKCDDSLKVVIGKYNMS